jgi:hypothetical protein
MEYNKMDSEIHNDEIYNDISKLHASLFQTFSDNLQEFTLDIVENMQRKFMEINWFPSTSNKDAFSNNRVSFQVEQFKRKYSGNKMTDTLFLASFGAFGIYLFYKMMEKTNAIPQ